jgi:hypothetical protein
MSIRIGVVLFMSHFSPPRPAQWLGSVHTIDFYPHADRTCFIAGTSNEYKNRFRKAPIDPLQHDDTLIV